MYRLPYSLLAVGILGVLVAGSSLVGLAPGTVPEAPPSRVSEPGDEQVQLVPDDLPRHARFGAAVDIDDGVAAIGAAPRSASGDDWRGAVYIYEREGDRWHRRTKVEGPDGFSVGHSLAVADDRVLVGAPKAQSDGERPGEAYVYEREDDQWTRSASLLPTGDTNETPYEFFGVSVALDGNRAVISARGERRKGRRAAAFVFRHDPDTGEWQQTAVLPRETKPAVGSAVAIDDDTLLFAKRRETPSSSLKVAIYHHNGTRWTASDTLSSPSGGRWSTYWFVPELELSGDRAVVAGLEDRRVPWGQRYCRPKAYVYKRTAHGERWSRRSSIGLDGRPHSCPETSATLAGDTLAGTFTFGQRTGPGAVTYTAGSGGSRWRERQHLTPGGDTNGTFGAALALSDGHLLVGAPGAKTSNGVQRGAAFVFGLDAEARRTPPNSVVSEADTARDSRCPDGWLGLVGLAGLLAVVGSAALVGCSREPGDTWGS